VSLIFTFLILISLSTFTILNANVQLIKKENQDSNSTLLVIAGIHGNEPGGYFAASILATHYKIKSKNVWIVPNINKKSILRNVRGIYGDMNRKFSFIKKNDKDIKVIKEIKKIIVQKNVSMILNLHDGHGFYRENGQGKTFNSSAWGQTCVIDQYKLKNNSLFGNLNNIATQVRENVNKKLLQEHHCFNVKNTKTKHDDKAMRQSLTFFAITHNKPAFAIETSKNLSSLSQKVFYQLLAIEEFMKVMNISYERDFQLNEKNIRKITHDYGTVTINNSLQLNLKNIRNYLNFFPLKKKNNTFHFSHPLGNYKKVRGKYILFIGNKEILTLKPQYFKHSKLCPKEFIAIIDTKKMLIKGGTEIKVNKKFLIPSSKNYRVNVIGYHAKNRSDDSNMPISLKKLSSKFSIDRSHKKYRVEIYHEKKFCSLSTIHFK